MSRPLLMSVTLVAALALPVAALPGTPVACDDPCRVESTSFAYVSPVVHLASGGSVEWGSLDTTHIHADGTGTGTTSCFDTVSFVDTRSEVVRFDVLDGALFATIGDETDECTTAEVLPDGRLAVPYYCLLHPVMRGTLVVSPST